MRFVLELTPTEHGRVEGVLVLQGSDEPQRFSGWLDLLRLLEKAAQVTEVWQPTLAQGDTGRNDAAAGGQGHGFVGLNEPRGPPAPLSRRRSCTTNSTPIQREGSLSTTRDTSRKTAIKLFNAPELCMFVHS